MTHCRFNVPSSWLLQFTNNLTSGSTKYLLSLKYQFGLEAVSMALCLREPAYALSHRTHHTCYLYSLTCITCTVLDQAKVYHLAVVQVYMHFPDFFLRRYGLMFFTTCWTFFPFLICPASFWISLKTKPTDAFSFHVSLGRVLHTWTVCSARNQPLFLILHLTVLVLLEHISLSSTIPCSEQSILTHLFPYLSFYRSPSPPQALFRPVGPRLVHCSMPEKLLYFYLSLWSCSELLPPFQCLKMQRPNLHTAFRRQHTLNSYGGIISWSYPFRTISNAGFAYWLLWISRLVFCHHLQNFLLNANGWAHNPSLHVEISPPCIGTQ